ncbi:MAG: LysE family translocator [Hyphomicrobiaceae bacterium]|nr:LysE family translocator [Hyphomicrobiaceae bacterium]
MTPQDYITFVLATAAVMATPGITISNVTGTAMAKGTVAGFWVEAGAGLGRLSMLLLLGFALDFVSGFIAAAFTWIKIVGAAYLLWLGIRAIRQPHLLTPERTPGRAAGLLVLRGFLVLWSNPKAFLFLGAFIPQFIDTNVSVWPQIAVLGAIWLCTAFIVDGAYILGAGRIRAALAKGGGNALGWVSGLVLIAAAVWLASQQNA